MKAGSPGRLGDRGGICAGRGVAQTSGSEGENYTPRVEIRPYGR